MGDGLGLEFHVAQGLRWDSDPPTVSFCVAALNECIPERYF